MKKIIRILSGYRSNILFADPDLKKNPDPTRSRSGSNPMHKRHKDSKLIAITEQQNQ
jgi:hypothetical protein